MTREQFQQAGRHIKIMDDVMLLEEKFPIKDYNEGRHSEMTIEAARDAIKFINNTSPMHLNNILPVIQEVLKLIKAEAERALGKL